ncbi:MAG: hypothetical protein ACP5OY_03420 [Halothiobacillaceae bacterium]
MAQRPDLWLNARAARMAATANPKETLKKSIPWIFSARLVAAHVRDGLRESTACVVDSRWGVLPQTGNAEFFSVPLHTRIVT